MQMKLCIKMSDDKSWLVLTSSHISPSGACVARLAFLQAKTGSKQRKQAKLTSLTGTWAATVLDSQWDQLTTTSQTYEEKETEEIEEPPDS